MKKIILFAAATLLCVQASAWGRGISGQVSSQMLTRFRRDVLDLQPKYVVILAGTNDIARNNGVISIENTLGNIISMVELAKYHKIKPILCSVTPSSGFRWRKDIQPSETIKALNALIREYAAQNRIPYVDYWTLLVNENGGLDENFAKDGTHPTLEAYKIMEDSLLKERVHLTMKPDWMFDVTSRQPDFPSGPRIYFGFIFCHAK